MSENKNYTEGWKSIRDIGSGGQGNTFLASNLYDEIAIIKVLKNQKDIERRTRMRREVVALETLSHPNIPKVIESNTRYFQDQSYKLYLAVDHIDGRTLEQYDFTQISFEDKIGLVKKLCDVVGYCHSIGIIHRDIKPDNIILRGDRVSDPVLIDFGLSFNADERDDDFRTPDGQHLGNRFLILPEQKVGESGKRDPRSDVSCIIGVFLYIITGQIPVTLFDHENKKPHQRIEAKAIIDLMPQHQRDFLNNLFDIGFNQIIGKRFQTTVSLQDQLVILENLKNSHGNSSDDLLKALRSKETNQSYQELKKINKIIENARYTAREYYRSICMELGEDYTGALSMYGSSSPWDSNHSISNKYTKTSISTYINAYTTGNELVVISKVTGNKHSSEVEVLRQPLLSELTYEVMYPLLRKQYIEMLTIVNSEAD